MSKLKNGPTGGGDSTLKDEQGGKGEKVYGHSGGQNEDTRENKVWNVKKKKKLARES